MTYKISDLFSYPEISKIFSTVENLTESLSKIDFLKLSEDKQTVSYNLDDEIQVFQILSIPIKMTKEEVAKKLELLDLKYSRLYKKSIYWYLSTNDKETQICAKNALRELYIDETKIKYENFSKGQLLKNIRIQIEKNSYKKDAKNLGVHSPNSPNQNSNEKRKGSDASYGSGGSGYGYKPKNNFGKKGENYSSGDNFSWRKGSGNAGNFKSSFDSSGKYGGHFKDSGYKGKSYKRNRFNSDINTGGKFRNQGNYMDEEIEIDVSSIKYPLTIKYKYTFQDLKNCFEKCKKEGYFNEPPKYLSQGIDEILVQEGGAQKDLVVLDSLINEFEKKEDTKESEDIHSGEQKPVIIVGETTIPKMNPLASMPKMFNKFDMVAGNIPQPQWTMNKDSAPFIPKSEP
ncbi:MAG: hypothetical protein MJ252_09970 [archaeon]|nr:hypothetical protein [archaeon]